MKTLLAALLLLLTGRAAPAIIFYNDSGGAAVYAENVIGLGSMAIENSGSFVAKSSDAMLNSLSTPCEPYALTNRVWTDSGSTEPFPTETAFYWTWRADRNVFSPDNFVLNPPYGNYAISNSAPGIWVGMVNNIAGWTNTSFPTGEWSPQTWMSSGYEMQSTKVVVSNGVVNPANIAPGTASINISGTAANVGNINGAAQIILGRNRYYWKLYGDEYGAYTIVRYSNAVPVMVYSQGLSETVLTSDGLSYSVADPYEQNGRRLYRDGAGHSIHFGEGQWVCQRGGSEAYAADNGSVFPPTNFPGLTLQYLYSVGTNTIPFNPGATWYYSHRPATLADRDWTPLTNATIVGMALPAFWRCDTGFLPATNTDFISLQHHTTNGPAYPVSFYGTPAIRYRRVGK